MNEGAILGEVKQGFHFIVTLKSLDGSGTNHTALYLYTIRVRSAGYKHKNLCRRSDFYKVSVEN